MTYPLIDLHMHSTFSDGTDTPVELLRKVRETGIGIFSLTDHDACGGAKEILAARSASDPFFIPGAEFSCRDENGKYHILAYNYDPDSPAVEAMVKRFHDLRIRKAEARIKWLQDAYGFTFSQKDLDALFQLENPGKPHIADMVVRNGYASDRAEAIRKHINPCPFVEYVRPEEAVQAALDAGGIPVLAHGFFGNGDLKNHPLSYDQMDACLIRLQDMGLQGVECFYSGFSEEQTENMLKLRDEHGLLYATAGSDYHGRNKTVALGDTGPAAGDRKSVYRELQPFLAACGYNLEQIE